MPGERQRQHQLVLDERKATGVPARTTSASLSPSTPRFPLVAGSSTLVRWSMGHSENRAPLARQRHGSLDVDRRRRATHRSAPRCAIRSADRRPIRRRHATARGHRRAFSEAALARELECIQPGTRMRATRDQRSQPGCELQIDATPAAKKRRIIPPRPGCQNVRKNNRRMPARLVLASTSRYRKAARATRAVRRRGAGCRRT